VTFTVKRRGDSARVHSSAGAALLARDESVGPVGMSSCSSAKVFMSCALIVDTGLSGSSSLPVRNNRTYYNNVIIKGCTLRPFC
jgi:hypothetical protein